MPRARWRDPRAAARPGANALWAVRPGRSVRNLWRADVFASPDHHRGKEGLRDPALGKRGFSFERMTCRAVTLDGERLPHPQTRIRQPSLWRVERRRLRRAGGRRRCRSHLQGKRCAGGLALDVDARLRHHEDRTPTYGYAATREAAMAAFAKSWRRG
jgi:hypothetical protein